MKKDDYTNTISDRIYLLRSEILGMTQQAFAEALSISFPHSISEYETGKIRPNMRRCLKMVHLAVEAGHPEVTLEHLRPDLVVNEDEGEL